MTYNVFSGTLNPTHFTSLHLLPVYLILHNYTVQLCMCVLYRPLMAQHASESSVEDRIKRNIYNIQRTSAQLDRNFARH